MKISYQITPEGTFRLMVASMAGISPAGPRLERGTPLPVDGFEFFDEGEARDSAARLQAYVDQNCPVGKTSAKRKGKKK
jgi:hypothetical protein